MGISQFFKVLGLACRSFVTAFKKPTEAQLFIEEKPEKPAQSQEASHLKLLYYLQHSGRLIDFLKEEITSFSDAQVGAAVRKIHQDCAQSLEELVTIRPLRMENEGATVQIHKGYNPAEIKIVGNVKGEGPFTGTLVHRGWKAHKLSLPKKMGENTNDVICPAEVEIK